MSVNVSIYIIPGDINPSNFKEYKCYNGIGSIFSTKDEIKVNKVSDGYSILYDEETFSQVDITLLAPAIYNTLGSNLPNIKVQMGLFYWMNEFLYTKFNMTTALKVLTFDRVLLGYKPADSLVVYKNTGSMLQTQILYKRSNNVNIEESDEDEDDEGDEYEDDGDNKPFPDDVAHMLEMYANYQEDEKKKKGKKGSKSYPSSRIMKIAKSPKKMYRRHGVLVCNKKNAIKKDEKIIKEFLKDFIPGSSQWKKDLRKDLLRRWMNVYTITKKRLKKAEKNYKREVRKSSVDSMKVLDLTNRLLNVPIDLWDDPNK